MPDALQDAVDASLGALLVDKDVTEVSALEGGFLEVIRRGQRERLDAILEGPLFGLLRDAPDGVVKLRGGHRLVAGALVDGRMALRIEKAAPLDATLDRLVEEGVLPPGIQPELVAAVLEGAGLLVIGPARAARQRVLAAVVRALQTRVAWFGLTESLSSLVPVPALGAASVDRAASNTRAPVDADALPTPSAAPDERRAVVDANPVVARARRAVALGADALCALDIAPADLAALARASLGAPLVASATAPSMDALTAVLDIDVVAFAGTTAVIAHAPDGRARLLELHGPTRADGAAPDDGAGAGEARGVAASGRSDGAGAARGVDASRAPRAGGATALAAAGGGAMSPGAGAALVASAVERRMVGAPAEVSGLRARPPLSSTTEEEPLPPLDALPENWASDAPDDDPGWELGHPAPSTSEDAPTPSPGAPAPSGTFDAALAAQKSRPSFAPKPPSAHPQANKLRTDPFGGLTFEPPPGGPPDGEDEA